MDGLCGSYAILNADIETFNGRHRNKLRNEEVFGSFTDARRKVVIWRYDYNAVRPHSALNGDTPTDARRALEQVEGSAPGARANPSTMRYAERGLSLRVREPRGALRSVRKSLALYDSARLPKRGRRQSSL